MEVFYLRGNRNNSGQSLVEVLVGLAVGVIFIGAAIGAIAFALRGNFETRTTQAASFLIQEYIDKVAALSESDWLKIYYPPSGTFPGSAKGSNSKFHVAINGSSKVILDGSTSTTIEGRQYTRYFSIENVNRDFCGIGSVAAGSESCIESLWQNGGISEDPSTQKITATVEWEANRSIKKIIYLTRYRNKIFWQGDWAGGYGQEFFATTTDGVIINNRYTTSTNIDYSNGSIQQSSVSVQGSLTSSVFDTMATSGVAINAIIWQGSLNGETPNAVGFQIAATSSQSGPWNFNGYDGTENTYYSGNSNISIPLNLKYTNNYRYFRYKVLLNGISNNPRIEDVIINWSP